MASANMEGVNVMATIPTSLNKASGAFDI
ncbi:hypothetical protein Goarm_007892, partial [Gossypium armourianum]|nr:hypothetical protein [Gossypium armourianum]